MRVPVTVWKVAAGVAMATVAIGIAPARAESGDASRMLSLTNQYRSSRGLPTLTIDAQLSSVAQQWASTLAAKGVLSHNSSLPSQVTGWKDLGENVGVGGTVDAVHNGFLASPTHLDNVVDPAFTRVGFGIVRPDARIFVVEVFMKPATAVAAPAAAAPAAVAAPVTASSKPAARPATSELSAWMVLSLEGLRSMEQGAASRG